MTWYLLVLWFQITHREKHTNDTLRPIDSHNMLTLPVMCTQQLPVLHCNNLLIQIFTLKRSIMSLLFKN